MRKLRFGIKFSFKMAQIAIKRITYSIHKNKLTEEKKEEYLYNLEKDWAISTIKYSELKVEVEGSKNLLNQTCVYVSNHQSMLDIPVIMMNVKDTSGAVAKIEMKKVPVISYWMKELGCVFLDRENGREGLKAILEAIEKIKGGRSMLIFPEGTRTRSNGVGDFKKGSLKLAVKANVPVVPITVNGTYKGLEGDPEDLIAKVIFHKPIHMESLSKEEKANLSEICREIIAEPLKESI
ncbi:lysophospholipid acyltransferase family protein [Clostridium sp. UBA1056]|uniref:lysophospholipid acyltransferase family protein n=1 Tax=unclassified Clostridium TaxID=2614128 RepID=UPI0032166EE6